MRAFILASLVAVASIGTLMQASAQAPKVAIIPWAMNGGTVTAVETANTALLKLFEKQGYEVIKQAEVNAAWKRDMNMEIPDTTVSEKDAFPPLPNAKDALALGKKVGADFVCVGRLKWHTKSVWVALGPKTKADAKVDCMIIDVKKEEIILDAKNASSNSSRKESGLETAGALLVSMGITALSGGPKTPHQQKAAVNAIAVAFDPWVKTLASSNKKIGG